MALFVLWLGYWAPHLIRRQADLADARTGDRFSGGLRVVAVSGGTVLRIGSTGREPAEPGQLPTGRGRGGAMTTGTGGSRLTGARPAPLVRAQDEVETPAQRRALAEQRARRAVRARRRFVLTLFLLLASLAAWVGVLAVPLPWGVAAVPTSFLLTALVLGRRAAVRARRAEEAVEAARRAARQRATQARALANGGPYAPRNRMRVTGTTDEVLPAAPKNGVLDELLTVPEPARAKIVDESGKPATDPVDDDAADEATTGVGGGAWDPVPVPLPTYVTKPPAPQVQPLAAWEAEVAKDAARKGDTAADDASARLAAAMRASAGKPAAGASVGDTADGGATSDGAGSGAATGEAPAGRSRGTSDTADGSGASGGPAPSSDPAMHPDEEELMRPSPRVRDETLAQPLEQILARRRAAG